MDRQNQYYLLLIEGRDLLSTAPHKAVSFFRHHLNVVPQDWAGHFDLGLGEALRLTGNSQQAISHLEVAYNGLADQFRCSVSKLIAQICIESQQFVKAQDWLQLAQTSCSADKEYLLLLTESAEGLCDYRSAEMNARLVLDLEPENLKALTSLAKAQLNLKKIDGATRTIDRIREISPLSPQVLFLQGRQLQAQKDYEGAKACLIEAVRLDPSLLGDSASLIVHLYKRLGTLDDAEEWLQKQLANEWSPEYCSILLTLLASLRLRTNGHQLAVEILKEALVYWNENPHAHFYLGICYAKQLKLLKAAQSYERSAQLLASQNGMLHDRIGMTTFRATWNYFLCLRFRRSCENLKHCVQWLKVVVKEDIQRQENR